jgi:hypothetical protein
VDNVLAEERRERQRQVLPPGPIRRPPRDPVTVLDHIARRGAVLLAAAAVGIAGGAVADDRRMGVAFGVAAALIVDATLRQRHEVDAPNRSQ